jgi:glycerophosphoryl diester phosphodiesterase
VTDLAWLVERPLAHRGLHDAAAGIIENSLSAVAAAAQAGYAIEIDVQAAADGAPVVFHDEVLDRLTAETGPVAALDAGALAAIPLSGSSTGDTIAPLAGVLDCVHGRVPLIIEVKTDWTGMPAFCARLAETLRDYSGRVAVMSFDPGAVAAFGVVAPGLPRGVVSEAFRGWRPPDASRLRTFSMRNLLHTPRTRPHFIAYCVDDLPAAAPFLVRWWLGVPLLAWTVRTQEQRARAGRWADQMIFEGFRP